MALAVRTFSITDDGKVLVRAAHVEVVSKFLRRIYDEPVMGYRAFSETLYEEERIRDPEQVGKALLLARFPRDFIRCLLGARMVNDTDVVNFAGLDRDAARDLLSVLVRKNALLSGKRAYVKTPAFISFLRDFVNSSELKEHEARVAQFQSVGANADKDPVLNKEF